MEQGELEGAAMGGDLVERQSKPPENESMVRIWLKIMCLILMIVGIVALVLWLAFQPKSLSAYAQEASLPAFDLKDSSNGTYLIYKLSVMLSFHNPNKKYSFFYEQLRALALYHEFQFGNSGSMLHYQWRNVSTPVHLTFEGRIRAPASVRLHFAGDSAQGFFPLKIRALTDLRLKNIVIDSQPFRPAIECDLLIPVPSNATSLSAGFARTKCDVNKFI